MRQDMTARLNDDSEGKHVSRFEVHVAQSDATRSRQTAKIHSMEIKSMFLKLDVVHESRENSANEPQEYLDSMETRTAMCNVFEMKGGSAMDTHALYLKHMASIGWSRLECVLLGTSRSHDLHYLFLVLGWGGQTRLARQCRPCTRAWLILQALRTL